MISTSSLHTRTHTHTHRVIHPYVCTNVHSCKLIHHTYLQKRKRKKSASVHTLAKGDGNLICSWLCQCRWEWHLVCCLASQDLVTPSSHETTVLVVTKGVLELFRKAVRKSRLRRGPHVGKLCHWKTQIMGPAPVTYFTVHMGVRRGLL